MQASTCTKHVVFLTDTAWLEFVCNFITWNIDLINYFTFTTGAEFNGSFSPENRLWSSWFRTNMAKLKYNVWTVIVNQFWEFTSIFKGPIFIKKYILLRNSHHRESHGCTRHCTFTTDSVYDQDLETRSKWDWKINKSGIWNKRDCWKVTHQNLGSVSVGAAPVCALTWLWVRH